MYTFLIDDSSIIINIPTWKSLCSVDQVFIAFAYAPAGLGPKKHVELINEKSIWYDNLFTTLKIIIRSPSTVYRSFLVNWNVHFLL